MALGAGHPLHPKEADHSPPALGRAGPSPTAVPAGAPGCPSPRSCTSGGPRDHGAMPVDQVELGAAPGRPQRTVPPPHRLHVEPVSTHQDVALLEKRAPWSPQPAGRGGPSGPSQHGAGTRLSALRGLLPKPGGHESIFEGPTPLQGCTLCQHLLPAPHCPHPFPLVHGASRPQSAGVPSAREWRHLAGLARPVLTNNSAGH